MEKVCLGLDLSCNHLGICAIPLYAIHQMPWFYAMTDNKVEQKNVQPYIVCDLLVPKDKKIESPDQFNARRKRVIEQVLDTAICKVRMLFPSAEIYVCLEDYVYGSHQMVYQTAEVGGLARHKLYMEKCFIRYTDPGSLKIWATGNARANKKDIIDYAISCNANSIFGIEKCMKYEKKKGIVVDSAGILTDLADAFCLADMMKTELLVREGLLEMTDLTSQQRRIFIRTTKWQPVNILDREFIHLDK